MASPEMPSLPKMAEDICKGVVYDPNAAMASLPGAQIANEPDFLDMLRGSVKTANAAGMYEDAIGSITHPDPSLFMGWSLVLPVLLIVLLSLLWCCMGCAQCCIRPKPVRQRPRGWLLIAGVLVVLTFITTMLAGRAVSHAGTGAKQLGCGAVGGVNSILSGETGPQIDGLTPDVPQEKWFGGLQELRDGLSTVYKETAEEVHRKEPVIDSLFKAMARKVTSTIKDATFARFGELQIDVVVRATGTGMTGSFSDLGIGVDSFTQYIQDDSVEKQIDQINSSALFAFKKDLRAEQRRIAKVDVTETVDSVRKGLAPIYDKVTAMGTTGSPLAGLSNGIAMVNVVVWLLVLAMFLAMQTCCSAHPKFVAGCCMHCCLLSALICFLLVVFFALDITAVGATCGLWLNPQTRSKFTEISITDGMMAANSSGKGRDELEKALQQSLVEPAVGVLDTCFKKDTSGAWMNTLFGENRNWGDLTQCITMVPWSDLNSDEPHWTYLMFKRTLSCLRADPWTATLPMTWRRLAASWVLDPATVTPEKFYKMMEGLTGEDVRKWDSVGKQVDEAALELVPKIQQDVWSRVRSKAETLIDSAYSSAPIYAKDKYKVLSDLKTVVDEEIGHLNVLLVQEVAANITKIQSAYHHILAKFLIEFDDKVVPKTNCAVVSRVQDRVIRHGLCGETGIGSSLSATMWLQIFLGASCITTACLCLSMSLFRVDRRMARETLILPGYEMAAPVRV